MEKVHYPRCRRILAMRSPRGRCRVSAVCSPSSCAAGGRRRWGGRGVRLFTRATSLGGTHSLIEHRASVEGPDTRTPQNLLRISVGLEHVDDLIGDLAQALG